MNSITSMPPITSLNTYAVPSIAPPAPVGGVQGTNPVSSATAFTQALTNAVGSVSGLQNNADQATAGLATGQGVDISQAMIAMEQASLGMHLAVQVRDKAVDAYQTLMNMQL